MRNLFVLSLALNLSLVLRVVYEGGKDGGPHGFSVEEQRGPSMADMGFGKEAQATQRTRLSVSSSSDQDVMEKVINLDQIDVIWAPRYCTVEGLVAVALSCKDNKALVLDDPEYVHYNAKNVDLTSSQNKSFMLLKKTTVSNGANQHKCPSRSQGREILLSSCNALPIVTEDDAVTESSRILWVPIKHGARVSQKDKLVLTYFFVILLLGWIPGVNAADENALLQGYTGTWICIVIVTIWAQHDYTIEGLLAVALSGCTENQVLVLAVAEYVHYNAETIDPIVTDGYTVTERNLWLLIKQHSRLYQKNKKGITFLLMIIMLGWIPGVTAAEKNASADSALVQGSTTTSTVVCVIIGTVASLYFSYKIFEWFTLPAPVFPEPDWILFSRKVRIRTEGHMESAKMHFELFDAEDKRAGSWECSFVTDGETVDMVSWGTHLFNMVLHIFVEQEGGEQEISFNQMDHPDFINTSKDVYFNNPDTGLLHFIGISPPRDDLPGEREILRKRIWDAHADATRW